MPKILHFADKRRNDVWQDPDNADNCSLIAAVQCQEAIKLLHGLEVITGRGFFFEGLSFYQDIITYKRKAECFSHETYKPVVELDVEARKLTLVKLSRLSIKIWVRMR
jgi:adenylyltransferase/sulfurtransferase